MSTAPTFTLNLSTLTLNAVATLLASIQDNASGASATALRDLLSIPAFAEVVKDRLAAEEKAANASHGPAGR